MVFSSAIFLLYFLPFFLSVYFLSPKFLKNYVALAASIFFYAWGAPQFVVVIVAATITNYFIVDFLHRINDEFQRRLILACSVSLNLGLLAYFKYSNFFIENLNEFILALGIRTIEWTKVILPIGISFFTFQSLSYSIDVYKRVNEPIKKLSNYLLYILFFPQLIAGPIIKYNDISGQLTSRVETIDKRLIGFYRFGIGLAKKVLIANVLAEHASGVFENELTELSMSDAWVGLLAYTFQIYFDFSGYSDMAIGLGMMMGFKFPENFNAPYSSRNISEFWRRWHITLGDFMKEYLYIPLGGNRVKSKGRLYFNLGFVFLLSGLWHGASWNFVVWGIFHGMFLILDRLFLIKLLDRLGPILSTIITFLIVMVGWVIFKLENMGDVKVYLTKLIDFHHLQLEPLNSLFTTVLIVAITFSFLPSFQFGKRMQEFVFNRNEYSLIGHFSFTGISLFIFVCSLIFLTSSSFNPFIYFRF